MQAHLASQTASQRWGSPGGGPCGFCSTPLLDVNNKQRSPPAMVWKGWIVAHPDFAPQAYRQSFSV